MKKITLLAALLVGGIFTSNAQHVEKPKLSEKVGTTPIQKGNWMVGTAIGSMGYSFEQKSFNINILPNAGYFVADGVAVGAQIGAGFQTVDGGKNIWNYSVMPFARYYFPEGSSETGRFFGQGAIGISGFDQKGNDKSETSFAFGVNAGYSHFVSKNVALEGMIGYNYSKSNLANAESQSGLGIAVGFQIFLGK
ncbi:hypothetical protein [Myroides sp. LJL119]